MTPERTFPAKLAYRIDEVVKASGLGRTSIYELIKEGRLQSLKVGGRRLVVADSLRQLLTLNGPEAGDDIR
jgi:excisionase family DNA binding protein